jgi:hypothetical protein
MNGQLLIVVTLPPRTWGQEKRVWCPVLLTMLTAQSTKSASSWLVSKGGVRWYVSAAPGKHAHSTHSLRGWSLRRRIFTGRKTKHISEHVHTWIRRSVERISGVLTMVYDNQNYWGSGHWPSSGILNTRTQTFLKLDLFPSSGGEKRHTDSVGSLRRS